MYEDLIKALRLAADKQRFGNYPTITVNVGTAYELATALESLTAQLAALQSENAQQNNSNEVLRAERDELHSNNCKLRATLSRVEAERDAAKRDIESILRSCTCEVRHNFCIRCDEPDGCDSDDCHDAKWRGVQGEQS